MEELPKRLAEQISFIIEIDKLKNIYRQNLVADGSRRENDAEHSWHLAVMAFLLAEYMPEPVDLLKVIKMVLLHDVVRSMRGCFLLRPAAAVGKQEREEVAAQRIYGLLPGDQDRELRELWEEFEERETPEARFAACLDRLQPLLLNFFTQGAPGASTTSPPGRCVSAWPPLAKRPQPWARWWSTLWRKPSS